MFGNKLKMMRKEKGLTQDELANFLGVTMSAVSLYERNKRMPDYKMVDKIASFFGTTSDYLIRDGDITDEELEDSEKSIKEKQADRLVKVYLQDVEWTKKDFQDIIAYIEGKKALKKQQLSKEFKDGGFIMDRIITHNSVQVNVEKSSYDLALIYAQARLQKKLKEVPDMEEDELIFHLQDDFCYAVAQLTETETETLISMLDSKK